uniref:Uncharacterized protein n=1 Tax=Neolamprologus brichardi TaxID=32507 RepID=A0A3Q4H4R0_NEOBR
MSPCRHGYQRGGGKACENAAGESSNRRKTKTKKPLNAFHREQKKEQQLPLHESSHQVAGRFVSMFPICFPFPLVKT